MEGTIVCSGLDLQAKAFSSLQAAFLLKPIPSVDEAIAQRLLYDANVYIIGIDVINPVKEVQKLTTADSHLAIILLVTPLKIKPVKQSIQFAPFVGKNTLVVPLSPELDLTTICKGAALRTRQKRSFHKLALLQKPLTKPPKKIAPEQLGIFLDYAPITAILVNDNFQVTTYNEQARRFFPAMSPGNVELGQLFSKDVEGTLKDFILDGHHPHLKKEINVQRRILELTSAEVYNEEGQKHFLVLFNDVTEQRLESSRIQSILEALPQMAWTSDEAGKTTYFTKGWYSYTGQLQAEALGLGWLSVVHDEDKKKLTAPWQLSTNTGKTFEQAARYKNFKGDYRWHLARASSIKNAAGEITMWVGTCTDIHDQILLTEELERKVVERTKSLQISNSELEQFAHVSSHDLQEPLRKIRTFAELIKENAYANLDVASQKYIDKISNTAERMSSSLKALLNFTKLHREEKFTDVDLNEIVAHVLVDLELLIVQKNACIAIEPLPTIKAVPIQMQQLFYNLLNNALKFTKLGIQPEIKISCRQMLAEEILQQPQLNRYKVYYEITVTDNGVGFEQQHAEKIFTIFQRLANKSEFEGTGIGLSLVKKVVSNHKGEIYASSQPDQGATFYVCLPA